jgi:hypothetical protein
MKSACTTGEMMVLADGKHFRAGVRRRKRVAVFFLDDAGRFGLGVVVGTDETAELFLRGLHGVLRRFGFMGVLHRHRRTCTQARRDHVRTLAGWHDVPGSAQRNRDEQSRERDRNVAERSTTSGAGCPAAVSAKRVAAPDDCA